MCSSIASSISHSEAFISSKGLLTITLTSSAPSLRDDLQQSIAVFPPPKTITFLPTEVVCSKAILVNQSIPIWIFFLPSSLPSIKRSLPLGAPVPTNIASKSSSNNDFMLLISELNLVSTPKLII